MPPPPIGALNWRVRLVRRTQTPQETPAVSIDETHDDELLIWAQILPLGQVTYYQGVMADPSIAPTHRITVRWQEYIDQTNAIVRTRIRPSGVVIQEIFRVRRFSEVDGDNRFVTFDCQLENVTT